MYSTLWGINSPFTGVFPSCRTSNVGQPDISATCNTLRMNGGIQILAVELDGDDGLVVTFSGGTTGGYVVEELVELRPIRERLKIKKIRSAPKVKALKV
jgi:hypothetical protein